MSPLSLFRFLTTALAACAMLPWTPRANAADSIAPTADKWSGFGNGPTHSGFYPATVGEAVIVEAWTKQFPNTLNQVAVENGRVFVTGRTSRSALALDAATGNPLWEYQFPAGVYFSAPTAFGGHIFVESYHSQNSQVLAIGQTNAVLARTFPFQTQGSNIFGPTLFGENLWIRGGYFGGLQGFNIGDGSTRFSVSLDQTDDWTPTYDGTAIYTCLSGVFRAHHPLTGAPLWSLNLGPPGAIILFASQPVVANQKAFMISFAPVAESVGNSVLLTAIDLVTRSLAWVGPLGTDPQTGRTVGYSGIPATDGERVYAIYNRTGVRAFDAQSGQMLGTYQADHALIGQPLITNDLVIVSTAMGGGLTYVFDKATYTLKRILRYGGHLSFADGFLYIAGQAYYSAGFPGPLEATLAAYKFDPDASPPPLAPLRNISTLLQVGSGYKVGIAGFIITGTQTKRIMLRAMGPSLQEVGVSGPVSDPFIGLDSSGKIGSSNDNWQTTALFGAFIAADQVAAIQASTLAPKHPKEAAMIVTLVPGTYTARAGPIDYRSGASLIEIYDLDPASGSKLANISTRGFLDPGQIMVAGFIVGYQDCRIIARAMSVDGNFPGIGDPSLELYDSNGNVLAFNDNWKDTQQSEIEATTIPPKTDLESAIVRTLSPGSYTAILRGANATLSGTALVEIYNLP